MTRIALLAGPDPGHVLPIVALARALQDAGADVAVWTGANRADVVASAGVAFRELPLAPPDPRHEDLGFRLWGLAEELAPATADALADFGPDLVVTDTLTMSGAFAAELIGVPWVEEIPHYLPDSDPALPPVGLGRTPSRLPLRRLDDARIRRRQSLSVADGAALRDAARGRLGIAASSGRVARLVANLPGLEHPRSRWPGDTHLVGPLSWDPPGDPLPVPPGPEPLVVVTDSSANTVPRSLGELALRGLRHVGVRLVVTTREPLDAWPAGCVVGSGPHGPLFAQADVIVTPGGGGGLGKAFRHGVPVVVAPLQGDQREAAARVVAAGAGRRLRDWPWSPRLLRAAVLAVLHDERYRAGAERLQAQARGLGADHAARIVLAIAAGRRPVARGPQR